MATDYTPVQGHCPACGESSLGVNGQGTLVCYYPGCPDRATAHLVLQDREVEHIVHLSEDGWVMRHPLRERVTGLENCELHTAAAEAAVQAAQQVMPAGSYRVSHKDGMPVSWTLVGP